MALWLRSWSRLLTVCQPLLLAVLLTMAGFSALGVQLGILHLVGLLLVVAVGSNYSLFFDWLRHQGSSDEDTLASLALANADHRAVVRPHRRIGDSGAVGDRACGGAGRPAGAAAVGRLRGCAIAAVHRAFALSEGPTRCQDAVWENSAPRQPRPCTRTKHPSNAGVRRPRSPPASVCTRWRRHRAAGARRLALGAGRRRPEPRGAHRRRPVAAQSPARPQPRPRLPTAAARATAVRADLDDGPDPEVTPRVLDLLDRAPRTRHLLLHRRARARRIRRWLREIVARGHERAEPQPQPPPPLLVARAARLRARDRRAQGVLADLTGVRPHCFRAPAGSAQPVARPGAAPPRPAPGELDAARLRHRRARCRRACWRA